VNFRPEMVAAIRRGKCETRRVANDNPNSPWYRGGCAYRVGRPGGYAICPGRGKSAVGRLELTVEPQLSAVENITDLGARREGFESRAAFLDYFLRLNRAASLETEVWALRFAVIEWDVLALAATLDELQRKEKEAA
jgi:hypothetical protein